jgi:hypothetical protein
MEGTRHERAALVGVAYFLGFITTFIWLGLNNSSPSPQATYASYAQSASVASALSQTAPTALEAVDDESGSSVTYQNGILEVSSLGESRSLSFNPEISGLAATDEFVSQGIHYGDLAFAVSPTEEYVFFCEMKEATAKTCLPFVYDTLSQSIYPLRKDGNRVELLVSAAVGASWKGSQLSVGGEVSQDPLKPWLLGIN